MKKVRIEDYIDDFANIFFPNEGLENWQRVLVVLVTVLIMSILLFISAQ
jgi:preprotein translocase subunit SecE